MKNLRAPFLGLIAISGIYRLWPYCMVAIAVLSLSLSAAASAFEIDYFVYATACVSDPTERCIMPQVDGTVQAPIHVPQQTASLSTGYFGGQTGYGTAYGYIGFGEIQGYSYSQATGDYLIGGDSEGIGHFEGVWRDTLTVTSSSLPIGTPVSLLLTMSLDATLAASQRGGDFDAAATFELGNSHLSIVANHAGTFHQVQTLVFSTRVGAVLSPVGELQALGGETDSPGTSEYKLVDASHTALFYIDVLTPGATYTTASGYTYFSSTPEAPTLVLLGSGLIGVACQLRRSLRFGPRTA